MTARRHGLAMAFLCVLSGFLGVWLGWSASTLVAQDRCLDAGGGRWDPTTRFCVFAAAN
jgi:hypothetical protein